jgi:hypothetical protein
LRAHDAGKKYLRDAGSPRSTTLIQPRLDLQPHACEASRGIGHLLIMRDLSLPVRAGQRALSSQPMRHRPQTRNPFAAGVFRAVIQNECVNAGFMNGRDGLRSRSTGSETHIGRLASCSKAPLTSAVIAAGQG